MMSGAAEKDAAVVGLGGEKLRRNEKIHQHFIDWMRVNDERGLKAVVVMAVHEEGTWQTGWSWPEEDGGFPWGLAAQGALQQASHDIGASARTPPKNDSE